MCRTKFDMGDKVMSGKNIFELGYKNICFYSPKGGSGKTTGIAQFAGYLALKGETLYKGESLKEGELPKGSKVLIIDADPSANTTKNFYIEPTKPRFMYPALMRMARTRNELPPKEAIMQCITPAFSEEMMQKGSPEIQAARANIFVAPSRRNPADLDLIELDKELVKADDYTFFYRFFEPIYEEFDYVLIDAPGQFTGSTYLNAVCMSHYIVSPSEADIYSTDALTEVDRIIRQATDELTKANQNHHLTHLGFYFSRYNTVRSLDQAMEQHSRNSSKYLRTYVKNLSIIPQLSGERELLAFVAPSRYKRSAQDEDISAFERLTIEILSRIKIFNEALYKQFEAWESKGGEH